MSKPNWVAEYNCACRVTLKSVTQAAINSHLKGKRHADAIAAIAAPAPDFQDYTCDCGRKMYHVKQLQIDQHRGSHSSASKGHLGGLSAPRAHACLHDVR